MSIGDIGGSLFGAIGILSALIDRAATGMGAQIDVAMFDSQLALLENPIARYLNTGGEPRRLGSRHPLVAPFQAFPTKDAPIVICVDTEAQWAQLCEAIGRSDLVGYPLFADGSSRARNHAKLEPELIAALAKRTRAEWLSVLDAAGVPSGPINSISDAVEDPQVVARGMIRRTGTGRFASQPIRFSTYQSASEEPAPKLGEHTQEVLAEFGFSVAEISAMKSEGAI
jgi:crotonobetainyl-CoA:carnitine CoA-transferase CaiB-like acyl-CoA transferase